MQAWRAWLEAESGDYRAAAVWADGYKQNISGLLESSHAFEYIILAKILLVLRDYHACDSLLSDLIAMLKDKDRIYYLIQACNLKALLYNGMKQEDAALQYLRRSLRIGLREGYQRTYIEEGAPMAKLFLSIINKSKDMNIDEEMASYAKMLYGYTVEDVVKFKKNSPEEAKTDLASLQQTGLLTKREEEVLKLLSSAMSNQEIADHLNISLVSVKFHCGNIYKKLGVNTRRKAIAKADELGWL